MEAKSFGRLASEHKIVVKTKKFRVCLVLGKVGRHRERKRGENIMGIIRIT